MATKKKLLQAAAGSAGGAGLDVDEVFSTYLYTGNESNLTITNGIDLSGEGGMVWAKKRNSSGYDPVIQDTERGAGKNLKTNSTGSEQTFTDAISSFNSDGFSFTGGGGSLWNQNTAEMASWTFRKAPKFFDVVTYTGDGSTSRAISHSLDSVPGMIVIKKTSSSGDWSTQHRSLSSWSHAMSLNSTNSALDQGSSRYPSDPTSTSFYVGHSTVVNGSGQTYVAYLFAHNNSDGEFGPDSNQDIIKCGSFTASSSKTASINLGFEPQWLMIKSSSVAEEWIILDNMRGLIVDRADHALFANFAIAEETGKNYVNLTPTGFDITDNVTASADYIYMAIRRGPLAEPTSATDVFAIDTADGTPLPTHTSGFVTDTVLRRINKNTTNNFDISSRLTQGRRLFPGLTNQEFSIATYSFDYMNGAYDITGTDAQDIAWMWKRAPGYFDVVAYTGNGTSGNTISHNLGVVPEMMWVKNRDTAGYDWFVYHKDLDATAPEDKYLRLNTTSAVADTSAYWNDTAPTASVFSLGNGAAVNTNNEDHIAYLFATVAGVSKVGSYTGNGTGQNIDCGFSSGARFVLIKRINLTQNWYLFDSVRGIVSGNDPYLMINNTTQEFSNDYLDPYSSGFAVTGSYVGTNDNGSTYIFYAIA